MSLLKPLPSFGRFLDPNVWSLLVQREPAREDQYPSRPLRRRRTTAAGLLLKRVLDIILSATAILLLWPIFLMAALAIKLDGNGPVIFRQRRAGLKAKEFVILKFRTMTVLEDGAAIKQVRRGDPRVTRVGKFLRRSSIDELPQLFNVLKGDMSLVGPRPHAVAHDNEYKFRIADYDFRHRVRPGMTGWAQVNGLRGETPSLQQMAARLECDRWYINNWSIGLDISILFRTCSEVLRDRAY
jgi:exopolysaccharide biosynthesis polyprenyl glycosylphosphotransferase